MVEFTLGQLLEASLAGVALAADAFGVSIALGAAENERCGIRKMLTSSFLFGGFQFLMPLGGFYLASLGGDTLRIYGKTIAALLLAGIGIKMIRDRDRKESVSFRFATLLLLAVATGIDAFFVGIGFFCAGNPHPLSDAVIIGIVTTAIAFTGVSIGKKSGRHLPASRAMIFGGYILIALGVKTLF